MDTFDRKVIDFHTHCFPDEIAPKAIDSLSKGYEIHTVFDGTINGLLKQMDIDGITASVIVPVATKPSQVEPINNWIAQVSSERIIGFGAMHPDYPDPEKEVARMASMGIKGIKFQPNWQGCRPDDQRMFPIYRAIEGSKLIALFHSGQELKPLPENLAPPEAFAEVHDRFPDMTMVVAHMGGYLMWDEVEKYLLGSDVYLDTSCSVPWALSDSRFVEMVRAHGIDKILFASDSPCSPASPQLQQILSLPLTDEEKEQIIWRNAARLLGIQEKERSEKGEYSRL